MNDRDPRRRRRPIDDEAKSHAFVPVTTLTFAVGKKSAALPQCDKKKDPDQMNDRDPRRRRRPIDDEAKSHAFVPVTTLTFAVGKKSAALPQCDKKKDPDQMNDRDPRRRRRPTLPPGVAVPSAQTGLTSLFGMVRGGPRRHGHLKIKLLVFCS